MTNIPTEACNFVESSSQKPLQISKEAINTIENEVYEYDCMRPCSTMSITFGFPVYAIHSKSQIGEAKFYFKSQIIVKKNVLVYKETQLLAEIGGYIGLILGFSLLDLGKLLQNAYERFQE